jgi:hypothetical protein
MCDLNPTLPLPCSPAVESVTLSCHEDGSDVPVVHALTDRVVGFDPIATARMDSCCPVAWLIPGMRKAEVSGVSFPDSLLICTKTPLSGARISFAKYSLVAERRIAIEATR